MFDCLNGFEDQFILDQINTTSHSAVTQQDGVSDPSELVAIPINIDGLTNGPESSDPPNTTDHSMISQDSGFPELNEIVLVTADISWTSE